MLIEFSVENFKSFRDRTTFSMIAANLKSEDKRLDENNVINASDDLKLLTSAAIYGKNASGKSNLGLALKFVQDFVLNSAGGKQSSDKIPVTPFRLNASTRHLPCSFEMVFLVEGVQYRYGFEVDETRVVAEWLYYVPSRREYALFERDAQEINIKSGFKEGRGLDEKTRHNALFLSVVAQFNGEIAQAILGWFRRLGVTSGLQDNDFHWYTVQCLREDNNKDKIIDFIKSLDVDINDLFAPKPPTVNALPNTLSMEQKKRIVDEWNDQILAVHPVYDERGTVVDTEIFNIDQEESQGTRKLIAMAGPLHSALETGMILFIDEMDARLHTHMTEAIVRMFNSKDTNPHGAQLIFVTHDTNLMDNALFRRDQIWFAEKDERGATHLVSLADFHERNDADFERRYLGGRYGGVPSLGDLNTLVGAVHG